LITLNIFALQFFYITHHGNIWMKVTLTKELLLKLKGKGFTMLVAENQNESDPVFIPTKWNVEELFEDTLNYGYQEHEIIIIDHASKHIDENDMNHIAVVMS